MGSIYFSNGLCDFLEEDKLIFTALHEMAHILHNHSPLTSLAIFGKEVLIAFITDHLKLPHKEVREIIRSLEILFRLITRQRTILDIFNAQKEIMADRFAILMMDSKEPAISCLLKLSQGNIKSPTHVTEEGRFQFPIITYEERINAIENYFQQIICPNCNKKLSWSPQNNQWYCHHCRQYFQ